MTSKRLVWEVTTRPSKEICEYEGGGRGLVQRIPSHGLLRRDILTASALTWMLQTVRQRAGEGASPLVGVRSVTPRILTVDFKSDLKCPLPLFSSEARRISGVILRNLGKPVRFA